MSTQTLFRAALLDPQAPLPPGVTSWNGSDPAQRFAVYRNNVTLSLIEAIEAGFPIVRTMVGEDFFRETARVFLRAEPPTSPLLMHYGEGFPAFLARFEPAASLPYLPDLARLELLRRRAFHAADAEPLAPDAFAALTPEQLPTLRLRLHPSLAVLASPFAIHALWAAHQGTLAIETVDPDQPEEVLVLRPAFTVLTLPLPPGGAGFFAALQSGATLGVAALEAGKTPGFDLAACMNVLVTQGGATALIPEGTRP